MENRAQLREPANILIFNTSRRDTAEYRCEVAAIEDQRDFDEILISLAVRGIHPHDHKRLKLSVLFMFVFYFRNYTSLFILKIHIYSLKQSFDECVDVLSSKDETQLFEVAWQLFVALGLACRISKLTAETKTCNSAQESLKFLCLTARFSE